MEFRIADTFTSSLAKLTNEEQKLVKNTVFDLQVNLENPGHQLHRLDGAQDKCFWSVRVNRDIRIIVHRSKSSLLLCYVDHHDNAYSWAKKRKLEPHPKTGAAQLVEIREEVKKVFVTKYVTEQVPLSQKRALFQKISDEELLGYGVPEEWLLDIKGADEDSILEIAGHLPLEAAEAVLELAVGGKPTPPITVSPELDPFSHPDAQRRFRIMKDVEELERALNSPWETWTVFLHPDQRELVEKDFNGPARVTGSAGTGKTIVALHRAVYLARQDSEPRVLLTTFTDALANVLKDKLKHLVGSCPKLGERIDVHSMDTIALRLYRYRPDKKQICSLEEARKIVNIHAGDVKELSYSLGFVFEEWCQVVDAWQLESWQEYRELKRLGRKTRLTEAQRQILWSIFEKVNQDLRERKLVTMAGIYLNLTSLYQTSQNSPFEYVVVDEAQDISIPQLRFLAALGKMESNSLFFAGDLGQRIFQHAFSWRSLGVDIRGRSKKLRVNYRTTHQIRRQADRLLGPEVSDVDGISDSRTDTISLLNGPVPEIKMFDTPDEEEAFITEWIRNALKQGLKPHEVAIVVRSENEISRATAVANKADLPFRLLDSSIHLEQGFGSICTMHLTKGLEFRAVIVMACDDEIIPSQERIETVTDDADLREVYETERHLLYVACTRARDFLLVTSGENASEFLEDFKGTSG